ncbi:MAG: DUF4838 domain-containing protein [Kiritimatiellia bacterium]|nr:DUF4838 domain-containing protein [Kiritimatiellia bacterium]
MATRSSRLRMTRLLGLLLALPGLAQDAPEPPPDASTVWVREGVPQTTLLVRTDACPITLRAVEDLAHYVERISGARLPMANSREAVQTPGIVWIGHHDGLDLVFPDRPDTSSGWEAIVILSRNGNVLLAGTDVAEGSRIQQAGTSLAIYHFIERHLGVRWFWPGELGEDVPHRPTLAFPDVAFTHTPIRQRGLRSSRNHHRYAAAFRGEEPGSAEVERITAEMDLQVADWMRRQRQNSGVYFRMMEAGHAFTEWRTKYAADHPEYFALHPDGQRGSIPAPPRYPKGAYDKICISNPDVARRWLDEASALLAGDKTRIVVSASPNDSAYSGLCVCEACQAWDVPGGRLFTYSWPGGVKKEMPAVTDRYVMFWNLLAAGLRERFPDRNAHVGVWAYGPYRTPPVQRTLEDNIMVGFVSPHFPSDDNAGTMTAEWAFWRGWAEKTRHLFWRPNLFYGHWGTPVVYPERLGENFRFMAENGLAGVDVDHIMNDWATQGLQYYLLAQLSWDPFLDVPALVEDYAVRAFGPGAPFMLDLIRLNTDRVARLQNEVIHQRAMRDYIGDLPRVFDPAYFAEAFALLSKAREATDAESRYRKRVEFMEMGVTFTQAQMEAIAAMRALRESRGNLMDRIAEAVHATEKRDGILRDLLGSFAINATRGFDRTAYDMNRMDPYLGPVGNEYTLLLNASQSESVFMLPTQWNFRLDPSDVGVAERWFDPEIRADLVWDTLLVTAPWGEQLRPEDPADPSVVVYHGAAWYKTEFNLPAHPNPHEELWLHFGAVDESVAVYWNGVLLGEQVFDARVDPEAWCKPRRFRVGDAARPGPQHLAVRVQALAGQGGITRPVFLQKRPRPVMDSRSAAWRFRTYSDPYGPLDDRTRMTERPGKYVGEQATVITISRKEGETAGHPYAALTLNSPRPFVGGVAYILTVRYRQNPVLDVLPEGRPPFQARLAFGRSDLPSERDERIWRDSPRASQEGSPPDQWEEMTFGIQPKQDSDRIALTLFFHCPGSYEMDEATLSPAHP